MFVVNIVPRISTWVGSRGLTVVNLNLVVGELSFFVMLICAQTKLVSRFLGMSGTSSEKLVIKYTSSINLSLIDFQSFLFH